jgi:hypothetical protein
MAELAARRYSPSPERWIEHPQNPSAFDPRQRDDLTGRQIGLRPAWGGPPVPNMAAYLKKPFSHNSIIAQKLPIRVAYKLRKFWNEPSAGLFRTGADAENTS